MHNIRKVSKNTIISCKSYYFKIILSVFMFIVTVVALICTVEKFHAWMMRNFIIFYKKLAKYCLGRGWGGVVGIDI